MSTRENWTPEIAYEEGEGDLTSKIPFIQVPTGEIMPHMLFVFESRDTGEVEPGLEGEEVPVVELDLHQYADMAILKRKLTFAEYDNIRFALGLESYRTASIKGAAITSNVRVALSADGTGNTMDKSHIMVDCNGDEIGPGHEQYVGPETSED